MRLLRSRFSSRQVDFIFELFFEPDLGPIWLKVRGAEGVKESVKKELATFRPV